MEMKQEIIHLALDNLGKIIGIQANWKDSSLLDGVLTLTIDGQLHHYCVSIKQEVRTHNLQEIEAWHRRDEHFLLIATRLSQKIKEELRAKGIPYLEANGNIYLKKEGLFLFVDTQSPLNIERSTGNRAFTKTGLKVLFYLLQHKEAINLTQRELADTTGVALGNIPQIINGLKDTGYLIPLNKGTYVWENRKALLEKWISDYATLLRPSLIKERYSLMGQWQEILFVGGKTVWGGEPGADILTNHLRPEKFLVYTRENRMELIKKYRFKPDQNGEVEVLEMFWKPNEDPIAPPILVYADLMQEGGKRNRETAEKIYHEYIQPNL